MTSGSGLLRSVRCDGFHLSHLASCKAHTSGCCKGVCTCHHDNRPLWTDELAACTRRPSEPSDTAAPLVNPVSTNGISRGRRDAFCNENQGNKSHYSSTYHQRWHSNTLRVTAWTHCYLLDWKKKGEVEWSCEDTFTGFSKPPSVWWKSAWQLRPIDRSEAPPCGCFPSIQGPLLLWVWGMKSSPPVMYKRRELLNRAGAGCRRECWSQISHHHKGIGFPTSLENATFKVTLCKFRKKEWCNVLLAKKS